MKSKNSKAIREQMPRTQFREHSTPLFLTSSFTFSSAEQMRDMFSGELEGDIYSRYGNPNLEEFIQKMCTLEGTESGFATASGMAAVYLGFASLLESGDHILASRSLFGSTHQMLCEILPRFGISHSYVDDENWEPCLQPNTKMLFVETPSNPGLELIDLEKAGAFCRNNDIIFAVDNCFATPFLQKPVEYGADIIIHSATKYIDGQGRVLGGIILGPEDLMEEVIFFARHTGPSMSPFHGWLLSKSLETLQIRMERHCENAMQIALYLESQTAIKRVFYPYLQSHPQFELAKAQMSDGGGIVTFELHEGEAAAMKFINKLRMISLTANLGDSRTIITHPATTTHAKLTPKEREAVGISDGLLRISAGLEEAQDIIEDLENSINKKGA